MKKTFYQSLMALMLLCSFAFLSCNDNKKKDSKTSNVEAVENAVTDEELDNLESSIDQIAAWVKEDADQSGTVGPTTLKAISECITQRDNLKGKSMTPAQSQRFEEDLNLRVELLIDIMKEVE